MKRVLSVLLLVTVVPCMASFNRTSGLVDIPTARVLPHLGFRVGADGSLGLQDLGEDADYNVHMSMGLFDVLEAYVDIYTIDDFTAAVGFCHRFFDHDNLSFAWGVHSISYSLDVSEVGHGDSVGWYDDLLYNNASYEKPFELGSAFVLATYALRHNVSMTAGIGRGRYVGYGSQSKYFNSNLYHEEGGDWAVGLFTGIEFAATENIRFMIDADGRDLNIGFGLRFRPVEFCFALTKAEWYVWTSDNYKPRLTASLSYLNMTEKPRPGIIAGKVVDEQGNPMSAMVGFVNGSIPGMMTDPATGRYEFSAVPAGVYEMYARCKGRESSLAKIRLRSGRAIYQDFRMYAPREPVKPPAPASLHGKVTDTRAGSPLVADITVLGTDIILESDSMGIFDIYDLPPGLYKVQVEAIGYETAVYPVTVSAGATQLLDVRMLQPADIVVLHGVKFEYNKATLLPESFPILDDAAALLMNHPEMRVEVQGHTDATGSDEYNRKLSYMRANAVRAYLVDVHMISQVRLVPVGYGESRPVATNTTEEGRAQNRRVEFFILK